MDYKKIGFRAGLEIHQQLETHKLFCQCQSEITDGTDYSFERFLRPTQSEMGDVDRTALEESKKNRRYVYVASHQSTCLVEADEEPPHTVNKEALDLCLTMTILLNAKPVDEIQFMRKIVIDGSNTSGFQRTALIAMDGTLGDVGIQTIALEEDAARKLTEKGKLVKYGLDRLGIPLIEIATDADIKNPEDVRKTAEQIGMLLQATGKVKKGLGTIRQDLNISISEGTRVEIKGIQSLSSISKVAENEALRQMDIIKIKDILNHRICKKDLENIRHYELTSIFKDCKSRVVNKQLSNNGCGKGIRLPGFDGLLKREYSRLGKEFSTYATKISSGIDGIIHSDELPNYGITKKEIKSIKKTLNIKENDAFVIAFGKKSVVDVALDAVIDRARVFLDGVPKDVRRCLPDDTTEYMRPLPGAARMYPETDVPPIRIRLDHIKRIKEHLPERPEEKHERFIRKYDLNNEQTKQILSSGYEKDFERLVKRFPKLKNTILRTFLNTFPELEKEEIDIYNIDDDVLDTIFLGLSDGKYAKEAVPEILKYLMKNKGVSLDDAIKKCGLYIIDETKVIKTVKKILLDRKEFVKQRGNDAFGPLMGIVMKELRGKADGKMISTILRKEIEKIM